MNYFLDTNVPLGYTIIHDKWHESSINFINDTCDDSLFWSNFVKDEYDRKLEIILNMAHDFLTSVSSILKLNENDFYTYDDFEKFILERTKFCKLDKVKKEKILNQFWQKNEFTFAISTVIYSNFVKYRIDFEKIYFKRDLKLNGIMTLHDCGLDNYLKYYQHVLRLYAGGIHSSDCKIIVDAHDCGLTHENLIFVSNDGEMLENIYKQDTSHLKIIEFRSCNT